MSRELRELIRRMALENGWGAPRIHAELLKLGFDVSERTVSRYLPRRPMNPDAVKRWLAFLRNHRDIIAGVDFFSVPTATFRLLHVFFRCHLSLEKDAPFGRAVTSRPSPAAKVVALPRVGEIHHRYEWRGGRRAA